MLRRVGADITVKIVSASSNQLTVAVLRNTYIYILLFSRVLNLLNLMSTLSVITGGYTPVALATMFHILQATATSSLTLPWDICPAPPHGSIFEYRQCDPKANDPGNVWYGASQNIELPVATTTGKQEADIEKTVARPSIVSTVGWIFVAISRIKFGRLRAFTRWDDAEIIFFNVLNLVLFLKWMGI
ncbi:hypothetical protein TWF706_007388 [Orbilia oligospora]|nr:hypothetical protein TWF706_007388 [Orbilia oligospora]